MSHSGLTMQQAVNRINRTIYESRSMARRLQREFARDPKTYGVRRDGRKKGR